MKQKLFFGGNIITMSCEGERAEAVLEEEGKILYAGGLAEAEKYCRGNEKRIDLKGKTMLPAFVDAHSHIALAAQFSSYVDLSGCESFEEIIEVLHAYRIKKNIAKSGILLAKGYDHNFLREKTHPTASVLDRVSEDIPIFLFHISGHMGVANSALLSLAQINKETPDVEGGRFGRDERGVPDGYVEETEAMKKVLTPVMERFSADRKKQLKAAQQMYLSYGITTVQEGAAEEGTLGLLTDFGKEGNLYLDVVAYFLMKNDKFKELEKWGCTKEYKNNFRIGGIKLILDGSPQGKSAWLSAPYEGEKDYCGYPAMKEEEVELLLRKAIERGCQILVHCNGDAAAQQFINCYKKAIEETGKTEGKEKLRPVMIHCQTVREEQLEEMKALGMIPSMFVDHVYQWGEVHLQNLGKRAESISPVQTALRKGLPVTLHQDTPILKPDMLKTVWCAVNRLTREGKVLGAAERVSVYEALRAVTINAAFSYFEEQRKGTIEAGKNADFVILSKDPFEVPKEEIKDIEVLETIKAGQTLFSKERWELWKEQSGPDGGEEEYGMLSERAF